MNDQLVADLNEFSASRLPGQLGMEILEAGREGVVARLRVTPPMIMGYGFVIAAVVVGLADTACGYGVGPYLEPGEGFTTIELKTNFLGSARAGETIVARATPAHVGRTTHVWDAVVENETTVKTIALFRATQLILRPDSRPRTASPDGAG